MTKPTLTKEFITTVEAFLKGARLKKFSKSINLINDSLKVGSWLKGASRSAPSGFGQGLSSCYLGNDMNHNFSMTFRHGYSFEGDLKKSYQESHDFAKNFVPDPDKKWQTKRLYASFLKVPYEIIEAWAAVCSEANVAIDFLNSARPIPVIVEGMDVSPKVTRTLEEMELLLGQTTLRFPLLERRENKYMMLNPYTGKEEEKIHVSYVPVWAKGIKHGLSRFSGTSSNGCPRCDACGKSIPSGWLVPLEGKEEKANQWMSMMVGTDCAKNLFGVKDIGVNTNVSKTIEKAKKDAVNARASYMERTGNTGK